MRYVTTLLALSTLILAITCANLYHQLVVARDLAGRDAASEVDLRARVAQLEQMRAGLATALRTPTSDPSTAPAPPVSPRDTLGTLPASLPRLPEMTEEQRLGLTRRRYRNLCRELALSDAEVEAILPVLVQQDLLANKPFANEPTGTAPESQRDQSALATLLGAEKAARFTALRKLEPARSAVRMLRLRLEDSGDPLSPEQQKALLGIVASQGVDPAPQRVAGDDSQRSMERMGTWMRDREQRLREDAAPVLTATQRRLLEEDASFDELMRKRADAILAPQAGSGAQTGRTP